MRKIIPVLFAILFVACSSEPPAPSAPPTPTEAPKPDCTDTEPKAPEKAEEDDVGETKPEVKIPDGDPPCDLIVNDIHEGTGAAVKAGGTVTAHYVGVSWSTGEEFDSSWGGEPAVFPLDRVIAGWQEGIPGMKEGGRRRLIIPPDLAYGAQPPPGIAPNETLVFVIDLIEAN